MSNAQFKRDFAKILSNTKEKTDTVVKRVALDLMTAMIEKSPVDTGRFRGNWQLGIGSVNDKIDSAVDKDGSSSISRTSIGLNNYKIGKTIYLTNSLPYANRLEYGYSQQAPGGMVRVTVVEYSQFLRRAAAAL